jgi:hypothetical protein
MSDGDEEVIDLQEKQHGQWEHGPPPVFVYLTGVFLSIQP